MVSLKAASRFDWEAAFLMTDCAKSNFAIQLNGEPRAIQKDARLTTLIQELKLKRGRIAIEINRAVIPKAEWDRVVLQPGDVVEVVNFVGGG